MTRGSHALYPLSGALLLGAIGLVVGCVAPISFDPGMAQGPLLGIFLTGPASSLLGLAVGFASAKRRVGPISFAVILAVAAIGVGSGSLLLSMPGKQWAAFVIDAEVHDCRAPSAYGDEALSRARALFGSDPTTAGWGKGRNWAREMQKKIISDDGVVLTMLVRRKLDVFEQRNQAHAGELSGKWERLDRMERYYSRAGNGCAGFPPGMRGFYAPKWEVSDVSPPDLVPTFMGLYVLERVPQNFEKLLPGGTQHRVAADGAPSARRR